MIIASVLVLGYLYWRFKIKPNFNNAIGTGGRAAASGHWRVARETPNRISITICRERSQLADEEAGKTQSRIPERSKQDSQTTCPEKSIAKQAPKQLGTFGTSNIHLVPPPPPAPPAFWTAAAPAMMPPPPPFVPPTFLPSGPPPPSLQPNNFGFGAAAVPYTPEAPPPYFHYPAPPNSQPQVPTQPTSAPPPDGPSAASRNGNDRTTQATQFAGDQGQKRRWFSLPFRFPTVGHARTISDSSPTATQSRSSSPLPPSVSSSSSDRDRGSSRSPSDGRARSSSARHHSMLQPSQPPRQHLHSTVEPRPDDIPSRSEPSVSSSYLNTSLEAVHDNQEQDSDARHRTRRSRRRESHGRRGTNRAARLNPSESIPLSTLGHRRRPTPRGPRRQPSSDLQYPSPEPRRARVSFTLPRDSDDLSTSSLRSSEHDGRSGTPTGHMQRGHRDEDAHGRRSQVKVKREQHGLADRITGTFYRMRRALRGEE